MRLNSKNNPVYSTNIHFIDKIHSDKPKRNFSDPHNPRSHNLIKRSVLGYKKDVLFGSAFAKANMSSSRKNLTLNDKFINLLMKNGNKLNATRIFYDSLKILYFKNLNSGNNISSVGQAGGNKKFTHIHLLQKKFDYSCKKQQFSFEQMKGKPHILTSNTVPVDTLHTYKENSQANNVRGALIKRKNIFLREKLQSLLHTHKNSDKHTFYDNLILTNANKLFIKAVENVKPSVETRNVKVSGMTYPVPAVIGKHRQQILAIRWLIECATKNNKNTSAFCECLASELYEALILSGKAIKRRDAMHKHAEYNRAYIRFKWW